MFNFLYSPWFWGTYCNYFHGFLSNLDETVSEHEDFSYKEKAGQHHPRHSTQPLGPFVLHGMNLLKDCWKFTKFWSEYIFKMATQQFKICMYINFVLSFYHQILKGNTLLIQS